MHYVCVFLGYASLVPVLSCQLDLLHAWLGLPYRVAGGVCCKHNGVLFILLPRLHVATVLLQHSTAQLSMAWHHTA